MLVTNTIVKCQDLGKESDLWDHQSRLRTTGQSQDYKMSMGCLIISPEAAGGSWSQGIRKEILPKSEGSAFSSACHGFCWLLACKGSPYSEAPRHLLLSQ